MYRAGVSERSTYAEYRNSGKTQVLPHRFLQDFYIQNCIYQQPGIQQKKENLFFTMNSHIIAIGISGIRCSLRICASIYWFNPFLLIMLKEADKDIENLCDTACCPSELSLERNTGLYQTAASSGQWQWTIRYHM